MKARSIVERVRKTINVLPEEDLFAILHRLEKMISELIGKDDYSFSPDGEILAPDFEDMYESYLKAQAYLTAQDWDCYGAFNEVFRVRYNDLTAYVIRNTTEKERNWRFS